MGFGRVGLEMSVRSPSQDAMYTRSYGSLGFGRAVRAPGINVEEDTWMRFKAMRLEENAQRYECR